MKKDLDSLMKKNKVDALFLSGAPAKSKSVYYMLGPLKLTGGYVLKARGKEPVLIHGSMERAEAAKSGLECVSMNDLDAMKFFRKAKNGFDGNVDFLKHLFRHFKVKGTVAFYGEAPMAYGHFLLGALSKGKLAVKIAKELDAGILSEARLTKDDSEINRIKALGVKAQRVMADMRRYLSSHRSRGNIVISKDGKPLTIGKAKHHLSELVHREGISVEVDTIFAQGRDSAVPHSCGTDKNPIKTGRTIVFDFFPCEKAGGYYFDITRTLCLGHVPKKAQKIYDCVYEAHELALAALRPGVSMKKLDELVCDCFEKNGYPTMRKDPKTNSGYVHSLGHGVGLDLHERPRMSHMAKAPEYLSTGFVFTVEPGLYFPDEGIGVRIEDMIAVHENGRIENLSGLTKELLVPLKG
jgi:Xaa-Pro aminopeptidase